MAFRWKFYIFLWVAYVVGMVVAIPMNYHSWSEKTFTHVKQALLAGTITEKAQQFDRYVESLTEHGFYEGHWGLFIKDDSTSFYVMHQNAMVLRDRLNQASREAETSPTLLAFAYDGINYDLQQVPDPVFAILWEKYWWTTFPVILGLIGLAVVFGFLPKKKHLEAAAEAAGEIAGEVI